MDKGPTAEGVKLIENWLAARNHYQTCNKKSERALIELNIAENKLGGWICPEDACDGEKFCVWYGDSLFMCTYRTTSTGTNFLLDIRKRGKSFIEEGG